MPSRKTKMKGSSSKGDAQQMPRQTRSISKETSVEPQRQTRTGRKRQASDASYSSEQYGDSHSTTATPSKRRKYDKSRVEAEVEHQRLQEVVEEEPEDEEITLGAVQGAENAENAGIEEYVSSRNVRFHAGVGNEEELLPSNESETSASRLVTHPPRLSIKRRVTASPSTDIAGESRRFKTTSTRHSLPPSLSQPGATQVTYVEEREFAPLSEILEERIQERKFKRARILELTRELVNARSEGDSSTCRQLEDEIAIANNELAALATVGNEDVLRPLNDDMLILASQEETQFPEPPQTQLDHISLRSSLVRTQEDVQTLERQQLEDAILVFSKQASEAKAKLEILQIEVQGLGFSSVDGNPTGVLQTIRDSFTAVRTSLEDLLLNSSHQYASNEDVLDHLVNILKEYALRLRDQDQVLEMKSSLNIKLGQQVHGLVDRLADCEMKNDDLHKKFNALDQANDDKERQIEDLQEELEVAANEHDILQDELEAKTGEMQVVQDQRIEIAKSIDLLTASLQRYRDEETRLQDLVTKMEEEYRLSVGKMNQERENTVRDLEERLDNECQLRTTADEHGKDQKSQILALELKFDQLEAVRSRLQEELVEMKAFRDEERDARQAAETDLDERTDEVAQLEKRVTQLEEDLDVLNTQLEDLRLTAEAERAERESAESELDELNVELEELNKNLNNKGIQANELRQKLYEVQQENDRKVQELQRTASERDEQYQRDFAEEVGRRETAEDLAQGRATTIQELTTSLEKLEEQMHHLLAERDGRISELEYILAEKDGAIDILQSDLQKTQALHDTHVEQTNEQRQELDASIASLQETITQHETQISSMRNEATVLARKYSVDLEDRDAHIEELRHATAEKEAQVADLIRENTGLERRVEQEAEQMLEYQNEKQNEVDGLRATIHEKQARILDVQEKAVAADERWQEFVSARDEDIASRDEEIAVLRETGEEKTRIIAVVTADADTLRRKFREYVLKTNGKLKGLREENATFKERLDRDSAELEEDAAQALEELDAMSVFQRNTIINTTSSSSHGQELVSRHTRGRKKRMLDSGIGMDMDSMLAE